MQPAKIIPGTVYARQEYGGRPLMRFKATCVQTNRTGPSAMHSKSKVYGYEVDERDEAVPHVDERGMINTSERVKEIIAETDEIMGPWQEYSELVERNNAAKAKAKAEREQMEGQRKFLAGILAGIAKLPSGDKSIGLDYGGVLVRDEAVRALTAALQLLIAKGGAQCR